MAGEAQHEGRIVNRGVGGWRFGRSVVDGQRWLMTPFVYVTIGGSDDHFGIRLGTISRHVWFVLTFVGPDSEIRS